MTQQCASEKYQVRKLTWEEVETIYRTHMQKDFPRGEIKPFTLLQTLQELGNNKSFGLYEGQNNLLAYAIFESPSQGTAWLLDYLAVCEGGRGLGLGSIFLQELRELLQAEEETCPVAIMGEIERIDQAQNAEELQTRTRRKQFYLKNGFCETGIFTKADGGIDYEIICFSIRKELRDGEAACAMRNIYETFFAEGEYAVYEN